MALSHAFSSPVADATGTLTIWNGATTASVAATDNVRPSDWNSAHVGYSTFAGNTAGASTWSGTNLVMAAVTNLTLSYAANGLSVIGPDLTPYLTTAALSNHSHGNPTLALTNISGTTASNSAGLTLSLSAGAGGAGSLNVSAGTTSNNLTALTFDNSNGVSFGLNGSVVTATVATNYLTTAAVSNHSHGASGANGSFGFQTLSFSNAQGVSFATSAGSAIVASVETSYAASNHSHGNPTLALTNLTGTTASASNGLTISLSAAAPGAGAVNFSAGTTSGNLDSVVFSNSNGVSFGLNGSTITASAVGGGGGAPASYFENVPIYFGTVHGNNIMTNSSFAVQPVILPTDISASFMRLPMSMLMNSTSFATSNNTSFTGSRAATIYAGVYTQMSGASSESLGLLYSTSVGQTIAHSFTAGANGSQYSVSISLTWPALGFSTDSTSFSYATSQTRIDLSSSQLTGFSQARRVDIPFGTSLPASNYWFVHGLSTGATSQVSAAQLYINALPNSHLQVTMAGVTWGGFNRATNATDSPKPGLGVMSSAALSPAATFEISRIASAFNHPHVVFQLHRTA